MKTSKEFKSGNHNIGFVSDYFLENFGEMEVSEGTTLSYRILQKRESDFDILGHAGMIECEMGDILVTLDSATKEMKDGNWNLFYPRGSAFVVGVGWFAGGRGWCVNTWERDGLDWHAGSRVFSPATGSRVLNTDPLSLESLSLQVIELRARVDALDK